MRQVLLYPGEDGYWVVECPSLPGCISQGETREAAIANIKEAIAAYVSALEEDGLPVPKERFACNCSGLRGIVIASAARQSRWGRRIVRKKVLERGRDCHGASASQ